MKIPFDISKRPEIESGRYKVVMYNTFGEEIAVRIICWNNKNIYAPIVALIDQGNEELPAQFSALGAVYDTHIVSAHPLFLIDTQTPELTEWEKAVRQLIVTANVADTGDDGIRENAKWLMREAEKEIVGQGYMIIQEKDYLEILERFHGNIEGF